ncbi:MAG: hypothetical protein JXQ73_31945 [Phycisphaerae bacterium]|nr:hypothetical protein [Phycisphaerae bacterium]
MKLGIRFAIACLLAVPAMGQTTYTYTIQKSGSQINLTASGSFLGGVLDVEEQQTNPVTKYDGSLLAQFPDGPFPGGSISFPGGSTAVGDVMRGLFSIPYPISPAIGGGAGTDPANYGIRLTAEVGLEIPPIPFPDPNTPLELGTFQSVQIDIALRDMVFDVSSSPPPIGIDGSSQFDASGELLQGVQVGLASGFADINGALVLKQDNILSWGAALLALQGVVALVPDLGLSVEGHLLSLTIDIGIGTRIDLSAIPDVLMLPNGTLEPGLVDFNPVSKKVTLTLPVSIVLPELGIPTEIFDLDLNLDGQLVATAGTKRLTLTEWNESWGDVQIDPAPADANDIQFLQGTEVTLTAFPIEGKSFRQWEIFDPNYPDDLNHATIDANPSTTIVMDTDMHVNAVWKCGSGAGPLLPAMFVMLGLVGVLGRRR